MKYIQELQAAGIIRPSSSPAGEGFFFVRKKDGSPCPINYWGLNDIIVKNHYPLSLMSATFEQLPRGKLTPNWTCITPTIWRMFDQVQFGG